jgi:hypothetical protein
MANLDADDWDGQTSRVAPMLQVSRATTVIGLKLKASYASTEGKLADSIVEDILQL